MYKMGIIMLDIFEGEVDSLTNKQMGRVYILP